MSGTVDSIKERLTIVDVVGQYVKLTRAGKYWKGLSPFTKEKTPSFFVSPDKGLYHCFSTGKGGDMFTFVGEMEGVDFKGALTILAEKAGVELVREAPGARDEREQLFAALEAATVFFVATLEQKPGACEYLEKRGLEKATLAHWRVGYAPKEWHALKEHLVQKGFSEATLLSAGLVKRPDREDGSADEKRTYDRFRGRIMFPIFDPSGRVIAFSGRIFEDDPTHPQAKYLNSPEGPLFDKSRALYGIQDAKSAIRSLGFSMLVEGQVDLLMAHQLGYRSAVATSGTAFTASHVEVLKRYSENVLLAYDGDTAGVQATYRAALLLLDAGLHVKAVALPVGMDPADVALTHPEQFKSCIKHAAHVVDFFVSHLVREVSDERKRIVEVGKVVLPLIARMTNAIDQAHAVRKTAEALKVPEDAIRDELKKLKTGAPSYESGGSGFIHADARLELLFGIFKTYDEAGDARAAGIAQALTDEYGAERFRTLSAGGASEIEAAKMLASENFFTLHTSPSEEASALETLLSERRRAGSVRTRSVALARALSEAEARGDTLEVERLMAELHELSKKLE